MSWSCPLPWPSTCLSCSLSTSCSSCIWSCLPHTPQTFSRLQPEGLEWGAGGAKPEHRKGDRAPGAQRGFPSAWWQKIPQSNYFLFAGSPGRVTIITDAINIYRKNFHSTFHFHWVFLSSLFLSLLSGYPPDSFFITLHLWATVMLHVFRYLWEELLCCFCRSAFLLYILHSGNRVFLYCLEMVHYYCWVYFFFSFGYIIKAFTGLVFLRKSL